jgi:hypothetical protein
MENGFITHIYIYHPKRSGSLEPTHKPTHPLSPMPPAASLGPLPFFPVPHPLITACTPHSLYFTHFNYSLHCIFNLHHISLVSFTTLHCIFNLRHISLVSFTRFIMLFCILFLFWHFILQTRI